MDSDFFKYQEIIKSTESPDQLSIKIQLCTSCQPKPNANFSDELFCCHFVKQGQEEPREQAIDVIKKEALVKVSIPILCVILEVNFNKPSGMQ